MSTFNFERSSSIQEVISIDSSSSFSGASTRSLKAVPNHHGRVICVDTPSSSENSSSESDVSIIEILDDDEEDELDQIDKIAQVKSDQNHADCLDSPSELKTNRKSPNDRFTEVRNVEDVAMSFSNMNLKNSSKNIEPDSKSSQRLLKSVLKENSEPASKQKSCDKLGQSTKFNTKMKDILLDSTTENNINHIHIWNHDTENDEYNLSFSNNTRIPAIRIPSPVYDVLFDHQKDGVAWMAGLHSRKIGGALMDDMGMGKSRTLLTYVGGLMRARSIRNTLIVAPLSVLRSWEAEANKVLTKCVPRIRIIVISSETSKVYRNQSLQRALKCSTKHPYLIITTYGLVASGPSDFVTEYSFFDYVVLDEAHVIKNPSTKTNKNCKIVCSNENTRRLILTGTPIMNHLNELWALMDFSTSGKILGKLPDFVKRFTRPIEAARDKDASNYVMRIGEKANLELQHILRPYFLQRLKIDFLADKLPMKSDFVVWTHISKKQRSMYEKYVSSGTSAVASVLSGEITSPLEAITWLKKLCGHPILVEKGTSDTHEMVKNHDPDDLILQSKKLYVLVALIDKLRSEGHKTLVFSQSTRMLDIIERVLYKNTLFRIDGSTKEKDRQRLVDDFNRDSSKARVMLLSTKAAGVGLTLIGADRVVVFDPSWNPAEDSQAIDRCYRIGQKKEVVVFRLIAAGTVEEKMYEKQVHKDGIRRVVMTKAGNATKRYFDRNELRKLFRLSDEGKCDVLELLGQNNQDDLLSVESLMGSELAMHNCIVGISKHDALYPANSVVTLLDDDFQTSSTFERLNGPTTQPRNTVVQYFAMKTNEAACTQFPRPTVMGRSQRVLHKETKGGNKENSIMALGSKARHPPKVLHLSKGQNEPTLFND